MPEPTTPTAATITVAATAAPVVLALPPALDAILPGLAEYSIVAVSAFAAALVQLGSQSDLTRAKGLLLVARIVMVSLALTSACAWLLIRIWPLQGGIPPTVAMSLVSFGLGLADGKWGAIGSALGNWALGLLPEKKK